MSYFLEQKCMLQIFLKNYWWGSRGFGGVWCLGGKDTMQNT